MTTSQATRIYWTVKAKELMESRLYPNDQCDPAPYLEFEAVMDELVKDSEDLAEIREKLRSGNFQLVAKDALDELHRAKHDMDELEKVFKGFDTIEMLKGSYHAE